jgi:phenylacetate-coenzyme A ligase PaaK-like adenylate-forming protein
VSESAQRSSAVRAAADRAAARFPWYARLLETAGEPPILLEADLATTYYAVTESGDDEVVYLTSGTSTGVRKRVRWSRGDHQRYVDHRVRLFRSLLGSTCRTAAADLGTGHAAASAAEIFAALALEGRDIDVAWPIEGHVASLADWQPDLLYTMPVILERLVAAGGLGYSPEWIVVLGDLAPPAWRSAMEARLGMLPGRIADVFGSIELGAIAYSDDRTGGYLFHEHVIPEITDSGLLALTALGRDAFPAVRYVSGDVVSGLRELELGGRTRWAYEKHLGRQGPELKHGEMLSVYAMADAIGSALPGVAWTVRRDGLEAVIEIDERAFTSETSGLVAAAVRAAHPAVDQMITSGLVGELRVEPREFAPGTSKRSVG